MVDFTSVFEVDVCFKSYVVESLNFLFEQGEDWVLKEIEVFEIVSLENFS